MQTEKELFTFTIYSEHCVGIVNQISIIFTRRGLNIEEFSGSPTSLEGIHKITITVRGDRPSMEKILKQIEKRIDVIRAFLYRDDEIVSQEIALYKIDAARLVKEPVLEPIIRRHNARVLEITPDYIVLEKSGQHEETLALLQELKPFGVRQYVTSGRICVTRSRHEHLDEHLALREQRREDKDN